MSKKGNKFFGILCLISATVLYFSSVKFWFYRNNSSYAASLTMTVVGAATAVTFTIIALAMFYPKRFKRLWSWWGNWS